MKYIAGLPVLPHLGDIESRLVLKKLAQAHASLAELKAVSESMPNQSILAGTLSLQEAKDSSEIENIITTNDEIFRSDYASQLFVSLAAKEVHNYANALREGVARVKRTKLISINDIIDIQAGIEENRAGLRKLPGTALKNDRTGATIYTPPQHPDEIVELMNNLELFINTPDTTGWDPLTKMAVIHHQFESIHPFYDGNGRTGRVINLLYLVQQGLLSSPVLYLSRFINHNRNDYYRLLQALRDSKYKAEVWEEWLLFMLSGVEQTSRQTTILLNQIKTLMLETKHRLRKDLMYLYSQDLINSLFRHPYTKIDFVAEELQVTRKTATKYLEALIEAGILSKIKRGKDNYYLNNGLFTLLHGVGERMREGLDR